MQEAGIPGGVGRSPGRAGARVPAGRRRGAAAGRDLGALLRPSCQVISSVLAGGFFSGCPPAFFRWVRAESCWVGSTARIYSKAFLGLSPEIWVVLAQRGVE